MISRERAKEIAEHELRVKADPALVSKVLSIEELAIREPMVYSAVELSRYWIVYLDGTSSKHESLFNLGPSQIMLISKADGEINYRGSAGDEG
jgi:hypothetical protein